jgi:hypothetical protein
LDWAGYHWRSKSVPTDDPGEPLAGLHGLMFAGERALATDLATFGWLVVVDGPMNDIQPVRTVRSPGRCHMALSR